MNLPSSYEHMLGHIRYYVKATVDLAWKLDRAVMTFFTVNGILDLNREPYAKV